MSTATARTDETMARAYYVFVSFAAGAAVLALEVLAARAMAPALGSGSATWAALLATALGMLAVGNLLGGLLSERANGNGPVIWALVVAAVYVLVFSQVHGPVLRWAAEPPLLVGTIIAAAATQAVPLAMLGIITPIILQYGHENKYGSDRGGRWAGIVLAAGCIGGIAGALVAGFLLLPGVGLTRSFLCVAVLLAGTALLGVWPERRWVAGLLLLASLVSAALCWARQDADRVVESLCGRLELRKTGSARLLLIDGLPQTTLPERLVPGEALRRGYLLEVALALRPRTETALIVGLGAGLAPRILAVYGVSCESVEIDPAVVAMARSEFGFTGSVTVGDGRAILARENRCFDLIFLDVCTADRLAWHLFTVEAMRLVRDRLTPAGVLAIQFIGDDGPWSASVVRTVETAFGKRHCLVPAPTTSRGPAGPCWVFAARDGLPAPPGELASHPHRASWRRLSLPATGCLLTDDHFGAERAWAETARRWRSLNAFPVGRPAGL